MTGPKPQDVFKARDSGKLPGELAETWGVTVEQIRELTMAEPPIYGDTEEWRRLAVYRLEAMIDDLQTLLGDQDLAATNVGTALYMRLLAAIETQGKLMGALQAGPPPADRHEVVIMDVDLSKVRPPDET